MALIIPKNNADEATLDATLRIYYEANGWLSNSDLIDRLSTSLIQMGKEDIKKEPQSYTKKTQVLAYYGFVAWKDPMNSQSCRALTELGKTFYEARIAKNKDAAIAILIKALTTCTFGRNVTRCNSDSDIEAPNVFIKASLLLGKLSNQQFAYILGEMELKGKTFVETILRLKLSSDLDNLEVLDDAKKMGRCKTYYCIEEMGFNFR